jgi:hypothetical protein
MCHRRARMSRSEALVPLFRLVTGRLPLTPVARATCAHAGSLLVPVLDKYRVADAFFASLLHVLAVAPNKRSPCVVVVCPVPPCAPVTAALSVNMVPKRWEGCRF